MKRLVYAVALAGGLAALYAATRRPRHLQTTVIMTVKAPIDTAFAYIAPINLTHIFRGTRLIPAVVDTSIKEGWKTAGLVRTISFSDGPTSQETLLAISPPTSFSYQNDHFTAPVLGFLLERLEGEWRFTAEGSDRTKIEWTYRAIPTNGLTGLLVEAVLIRAIHAMLENALTIAKNDLESGQVAEGRFAAPVHQPRAALGTQGAADRPRTDRGRGHSGYHAVEPDTAQC